MVKQAISSAIANHLNDPRINGLVSITQVDMSPDLRTAEVYISILASDEKAQSRTFIAIQHARRHLQSFVARAVSSKFCPVLRLHQDEKFKKTLETMNLIDLAASEYRDRLPDSDDEQKTVETDEPTLTVKREDYEEQ